MCSILIICDDYGLSESANGICARNIVNELLVQNNSVYVLSDSHILDDRINTTYVSRDWFKKFSDKYSKSRTLIKKYLYIIIHLFRGAISAIVYPNVNPIRSYRVYKEAIRIIKNNHIDTVVTFYRPYESLKAAIKIKQLMHSNICVVTYHLDLIQSPSNCSQFIRKYKMYKGKRALINEIKTVDRVLLPKSARYLNYKMPKIKYLDFPLYIKPQIENKETFGKSSNVRMIYVGSLDWENRNPLYFIEVLNKLNAISEQCIEWHIWGRLADRKTEELICNCINVVYHGMIENEKVPTLLTESDFLVNISNQLTYQMVPSKIFQLFAVNKPIVNIVQNKNDYSLEYFNRTNCTLNIFTADKIERNVTLLKEFMSKKNNIINNDNTFYEATPEYAVRTILGEMENNK